MARLPGIVRARLNSDAPRWHRLWSMRSTIALLVLNGAVGSLDFFAGTEIVAAHPLAFAFANVAGTTVIGLARVYKQPGLG